MEAMEKKTEIRTVGIMGAGAVGAYFLWGMRNLPVSYTHLTLPTT